MYFFFNRGIIVCTIEQLIVIDLKRYFNESSLEVSFTSPVSSFLSVFPLLATPEMRCFWCWLVCSFAVVAVWQIIIK